jgi:hypothetical protein
MKANPLAKSYAQLTPEERFRLILAADGRGDETERDRLIQVGERIELAVQDHTPYTDAFTELAQLTYIEVLEDASRYVDAFARFNDYLDWSDGEGAQHSGDGSEADDDPSEQAEDEKGDAEDDRREKPARADPASPTGQRYLGLEQATGYVLRTKVDGWKLFCEEMNVPPFLTWQEMPGFDRLQSRLDRAKEYGFEREEFLCWLNAVRPSGSPELTTVRLTANAVAAAMKEAFRECVRCWGG